VLGGHRLQPNAVSLEDYGLQLDHRAQNVSR
jgi:hypothetical protein